MNGYWHNLMTGCMVLSSIRVGVSRNSTSDSKAEEHVLVLLLETRKLARSSRQKCQFCAALSFVKSFSERELTAWTGHFNLIFRALLPASINPSVTSNWNKGTSCKTQERSVGSCQKFSKLFLLFPTSLSNVTNQARFPGLASSTPCLIPFRRPNITTPPGPRLPVSLPWTTCAESRKVHIR